MLPCPGSPVRRGLCATVTGSLRLTDPLTAESYGLGAYTFGLFMVASLDGMGILQLVPDSSLAHVLACVRP